MEPYQLRVVKEKEELDDKLNKLTDYLMTPHSHNLPEDQQLLMYEQKYTMQKYSDILEKRIALFK